ncbi:MAG: type VI secretion system tube protein Hcp [Candidatus Contendobacter sp.]|nr:type VI secretion system tube protein Hcp [Candidatus Contendobacter sp.]
MARLDAFLDLKSGNVKGESPEEGYKECIQLLSWSWGCSNAGSASHGGGEGVGAVNVQDFHFTMTMNAASAPLMTLCTTGKHFPTSIFTQRKSTGDETPQKFLEITMSDVMVSSYQTGSGGPELPHESCSINFSKVQMEYFVQGADGKLKSAGKMGWDVKLAKKV